MPDEIDLLSPLRRYWGYDSFRPFQERIVRSLLGGCDVAVIMPTGGGKSLCYQLPALVLGRTTVVVSPLIALMQDQAAQLAQMGIPAAVLNSARDPREQFDVMRKAKQGAYRLLYLSPERLARADTIGWLQQVPVAFFAIDEAHCISEWGHEFRPEYRQLSCLRQSFPGTPIAAFTASATQRVRHDILHQLQLRSPHRYIVSFHRPNLRYLVHECDSKMQQRLLVKALRACAGSNVIVYAPTIATVEETVDFLADKGIDAIPYHGKMDTGTRQRNQERWMSDEVRVLVGTIAFGLGINKASVRAVIHLSLPKSIEQYYQEAGRAGRDGLEADCALLWRKKDAGLLAHFIDKLQNADEQQRAWQRYHAVRRFAESAKCRHRQICLHFGETPKWESCGMCDVCGPVPAWMAAPERAEKPARRRRDRQQPERAEVALAAPLAELPPASIRRSPMPPPAMSSPAPLSAEEQELREFLRQWRRGVAQRSGVSAFIVLTDAALNDLCRRKPTTLTELLQVSGVGERKAEQYGRDIFGALEAFRNGARAEIFEEKRTTPAEETIRLLAEGRTIEEIANMRGRQSTTVVSMIADLVEKGRVPFDAAWVDADKARLIEEACSRLGYGRLAPIKEALPQEIGYEEIRLVTARLRREEIEKQGVK